MGCNSTVDITSPLLKQVNNVLDEVVTGSIIQEGQLSTAKLQKPRLRARGLVQKLTTQLGEVQKAQMTPTSFTDIEVKRCAAVIVTAFLNPITLKWDYDRFAKSEKKQVSGKFFAQNKLGTFTTPTTIVDMNRKILAWYLPGILLPYQVEQWNEAIVTLKGQLRQSLMSRDDSWRAQGFVLDGNESIFGSGRLVISVGRLIPGHKHLKDPLYPTPNLQSKAIQKWLKMIDPMERLMDAVLQVVHPDMWTANVDAIQLLVQQLQWPLPTWPTVYGGVDVIANRVTPRHCDQGGAISFYDHLLSLGQGHDVKFRLDDLHAQFDYFSGTSILFTGKVLAHSVPMWSGGERVVIAHYSKDDVHDQLGIKRPALPSQIGWLLTHQ